MIRGLLVLLLAGAGSATATPADAPPSRIVTLAPMISEWTAEILGPEETKRRIAGVSEYSIYPADLREKPRVGPYPRLDLEAILALGPDLVIGSEEYTLPEQIARMRRLALPLRILPRERFGTMEAWITQLGAALGEPERAAKAVEKWRHARSELRRGAGPGRRAFVEIQHEPLITIGAKSFLTEALREAGFETIFSELKDGYPKVTLESVVRRNPEWIFLLRHEDGEDAVRRSRDAWSRFADLPAVRQGRIRLLSADDFARCNLRLLSALKTMGSLHDH